MTLPARLRPPELPVSGAQLPAVGVRIGLGVLGGALTVVAYSDGWIVIGILLSVIAAVVPEYLTSWLLILFLAIGELSHHASVNWQFLVLLAGVHLLHVLGSLALELPWRSWIQPALFIAPLYRFVVIQIPCQIAAVVSTLLLAPNAHGHRPVTVAEAAVIGGLALGGLAVVLLGAGKEPTAGLRGSA